ncbi:unnamed protein product [Clonostachys rosea f. rosea IK726]|uniref:Uncharacterized protein n=1 Tax=Clonostachys rosea f. rosea IK726 TaxID=1349383 RepID=A0ACA9UJQ1_BIOOC|nr:unnamed protein product [Clonostachys rosea f. rosea IK726]
MIPKTDVDRYECGTVGADPKVRSSELKKQETTAQAPICPPIFFKIASVDIPEGDKAVTVKVIDNGARITGPLSFFMDPPVLDNMQSRQ